MRVDQGAKDGGGAGRFGSSGLLIALLATGAIGVTLMIWLGSRAMEMSGRNMELNKLLDKKTKTCADRSRIAECEKILGQIEALEKEMARERGEAPANGGAEQSLSGH